MKTLLRLFGLAFALACLNCVCHAQGTGALVSDLLPAFKNMGTFNGATAYPANSVVNPAGSTALYYAPSAIAPGGAAPPGGAWVAFGGGGGSGGAAPAGANALQVSNGAGTALAVATPAIVVNALGASAGYEQYGDSKPCATGATATLSGGVARSAVQNGFVELLHSIFGGESNNNCVSGDTSVDTNYYVFLHADNEGVGGPNYGLEYFTNDANNANGASANYQASVKLGAQGASLFAAIPRANKTFAQDAAVTTGGTWTPSVNAQQSWGRVSTTNGSVINLPVIVGADGHAVLWSKIIDSNGGTYTVNVDSGALLADPVTSSTTFNATGYGGTPILSAHGKNYEYVGYVFSGLSAGTHSFHVTVTSATGAGNIVEIGGAASLPAANAGLPQVFQSGVEFQNSGTGGAADTLTATYDGIASGIATSLSGLTLNTSFVDTRNALLNAASCGNGSEATMFSVCYADSLHFNNAGHAAVAAAYAAVASAINSTLTVGALKDPRNGPMSVYAYGQPPVDFSHWLNINNARAGGGKHGYGITFNCAYGGLNCDGVGDLANYGLSAVMSGSNFNVLQCKSAHCGTGSTNFTQILTAQPNGSLCLFDAGTTPGQCGTSQMAYFTSSAAFLGGQPGYFAPGAWLTAIGQGSATSVAATAGTNQNSFLFRFRANYWSGTANAPSDAGFKTVVSTGTTPTTTLTFACQYNPSTCGVDFSAATQPNNLGAVQTSTIAASGGYTQTGSGANTFTGIVALPAGSTVGGAAIGSGGGGASTPATSTLLKGTGTANGVAAATQSDVTGLIGTGVYDAAGAATTAANAAAAASLPLAGGTMTGPLATPQLNSTRYVATTIQAAVTAACGAGRGRVVIPAGVTPSDTVGAVTGCANVAIVDETGGVSKTYTTTSTAYSLGGPGPGLQFLGRNPGTGPTQPANTIGHASSIATVATPYVVRDPSSITGGIMYEPAPTIDSDGYNSSTRAPATSAQIQSQIGASVYDPSGAATAAANVAQAASAPKWSIISSRPMSTVTNTILNGTGYTNNQGTSDYLETIPSGDNPKAIELCYTNFMANGSAPTTGENYNFNNINLTASVAPNAGVQTGGLFATVNRFQATISGRVYYTLQPGGIVCTDPIYGAYPSGSSYYVATGVSANSAPAPAAPTLATASTGGLLTNGTYYVSVTYVQPDGSNSAASTPTSIALSGGTSTQTITVTAPSANSAGYRVFVGTTTTLQCDTGTGIMAFGVNQVIQTTSTALNCVNGSSASNYIPQGMGTAGGTGAGASNSGEGTSAGDRTNVGNRISSNYNATAFGPYYILGLGKYPSLCISADSIGRSSHDDAFGPTLGGYAQRAALNQTSNRFFQTGITPNWGFVNVAMPSETAATFNSSLGLKRFQVCSLASTVLESYGINDIGVTSSALLTNLVQIDANYLAAGVNLVRGTLLPHLNYTTDGWQTLAGESFTFTGFEAQRRQINNVIRGAAAAGTNISGEVPFTVKPNATYAYNTNWYAGGDGSTTVFEPAYPIDQTGTTTVLVNGTSQPYTYGGTGAINGSSGSYAQYVTMTTAPANGATVTISYLAAPSLKALLGNPTAATFNIFDTASYVEYGPGGSLTLNGGLWGPAGAAAVTGLTVTSANTVSLTNTGGFGGGITTDQYRGYSVAITSDSSATGAVGETALVLFNTPTVITLGGLTGLSGGAAVAPDANAVFSIINSTDTYEGVHPLTRPDQVIGAGLVASGLVK